MFWTEKCPKKDSDVFFFTKKRFGFFVPERYTASSGAERFRKSGRWKRERPITPTGLNFLRRTDETAENPSHRL